MKKVFVSLIVLAILVSGCAPFISFITGDSPTPSDNPTDEQTSTEGSTATEKPVENLPDPSTCEGKLAFFQKDIEDSDSRYDELESEIYKSLLEMKQLKTSGSEIEIQARENTIMTMKEERKELQGKIDGLKIHIKKLPCYDAQIDSQ